MIDLTWHIDTPFEIYLVDDNGKGSPVVGEIIEFEDGDNVVVLAVDGDRMTVQKVP